MQRAPKQATRPTALVPAQAVYRTTLQCTNRTIYHMRVYIVVQTVQLMSLVSTKGHFLVCGTSHFRTFQGTGTPLQTVGAAQIERGTVRVGVMLEGQNSLHTFVIPRPDLLDE